MVEITHHLAHYNLVLKLPGSCRLDCKGIAILIGTTAAIADIFYILDI